MNIARRRRTGFLLALIVAAASGLACSKAPQSESDKHPEPSLANQAQAVREGKSEQIRLDHVLVTDDDLRHLDGLEDSLLRINLSRTEITNDGLARLSHFPRLEQLRLASSRIDDAGLLYLAELKHLRFLHLIDVPLSDAGLEHLHPLESLESLYLDGTRASDDAKSRLVEALPNVHVHFDGGHHRHDSHAVDHKHPGDP
jgi:hypothetical protein